MAVKRSNEKWQDGKIEKLIDLYEENPCLWDVLGKSYQKRDVKERALAAISNELDVQIKDIKSKWNVIRELNKVKPSKSGQSTGDLYVSQWIIWDSFSSCNL